MRSSAQSAKRLRTVTLHQRLDGSGADIAGRDLGPEVADGLFGNPDVGPHQLEDRHVRFAPVEELEPGDAESLLKNFRIVASRASGQASSQIEVVGRADGERNPAALDEYGFDDVDVRDVHPAAEGVVHDEDVLRLHVVAVLFQQRFHGVGDRSQVQRDRHALRDHLALGVAQRGGIVETVPDDGGVSRSIEGQGHFVGGRREGVLDDFAGDGIDLSHRRTPGSGSPAGPARRARRGERRWWNRIRRSTVGHSGDLPGRCGPERECP